MAMPGETYKIFSLRFPVRLAERLERAKALFGSGELSMGEAARRLLEQRLDQVDTDTQRRSARETLLDIRAKWQGNQELTWAEWLCLADYGYRAYSHATLGARSLVDRALLAANLEAFGALIQARQRYTPEAIDPESDRYYLGNLGGRGSADLCVRLQEVLTTLPDAPGPSIGYFGGRNLHTTLRDEPWVARIPLHATLVPYLEALVQVAIRGYWYEERLPLQPVEPVEGALSAFPLSSTRHGRYILSPLADETHFSVALELGQAPAFCMALDNYVEFTEFAMLVARARATQEPVGRHRIAGFDLMWNTQEAGARGFWLTVGRFRFFLSAEEIAELETLCQLACAKPDVQAHLGRLAFVYGRL